MNHLICNTRSQPQHTNHKITTLTIQHKISILAIDNITFLYSPQTTQDSILVTNNTKFLYSSHTTYDFYTRHGQHKISILITDNTRFLYSPLNLPRRTQYSILVTDNKRFLYTPWTTQEFYTHHKQHNIFFHTSQTTQDFYISHMQHKISILTTDIHAHANTSPLITHTLIPAHSLRTL